MKTFVLDTSVLLHDPDCIFSFEENDVVIPIVVLEELDRFKTEPGERGVNSRTVIRHLDSLRTKGDIQKGINLGEGLGQLSVFSQNIEFQFRHLVRTNDSFIIGCARFISDEKKSEVSLVSKDINMRLKADSLGVSAADYNTDRAEAGQIGLVREVTCDKFLINRLYDTHKVETDDLSIECEENCCVVLKSYCGTASALARFSGGYLRLVNGRDDSIYGVRPRSAEQRFLADVLMDEKIDLIVCAGVAGSGKTLMSMAAGMEFVMNNRKLNGHHVDRLMITKAIEEVGKGIGFTPGDKKEKMMEWLKPFYDNMEYLLRQDTKLSLDKLEETGRLEIDALTYIRGRSLMNRFVIVDEIQNLAPKIIRTIVSRIANGSKLVLLGDLSQVDNPYLSEKNNGLAHAMNRLHGEPNVAVLNLKKTERSALARLAIEKL